MRTLTELFFGANDNKKPITHLFAEVTAGTLTDGVCGVNTPNGWFFTRFTKD